MRILLLFLFAVSLTSCIQDDDSEPLYDLNCIPTGNRITFDEVKNQYSTYEATTRQIEEVVEHEVYSIINNQSTETEYFKFSINSNAKCAAILKHERTIYTNDGQGNINTEKITYDILDWKLSEYSYYEDGFMGGNTVIIGENDARKFFLLF